MTIGKTKEMINLTPKTITVKTNDGKEYIYPPSGKVAKVVMETIKDESASDGCPCGFVEYAVANLIDFIPIPEGYEIREIFDQDNRKYRHIFVKLEPTNGDIVEVIKLDGLFEVEYESDSGDLYRKYYQPKVSSEEEAICKEIEGEFIVSDFFANVFFEGDYVCPYVKLYIPDEGSTAIRENGEVVAVRRLLRL